MAARVPSILFHCTYVKNLAEIAKRGLRPGLAPNLVRAAPGNLRGVYLSDLAGVRCWYQRLVEHAQHDSDTPVEDGLVPVVLEVRTVCDVVTDERGTRDSLALAVVCPRPIVPGALKVWTGQRWSGTADHDELVQAGTRWEVDEDHEEGGYLSLLDAHRSPLVPKEMR
jgi:hypothetical protein